MFGPEQVKELAVARFEMVIRDVVGHPTAPGSAWAAADPDPAVQKKTMTVDLLEPCGAARCARVSAQYDVDPPAAARRALRFAAAFLARNGVDPAQAEVVDANLDYRDELLLEPGDPRGPRRDLLPNRTGDLRRSAGKADPGGAPDLPGAALDLPLTGASYGSRW